MSLRVFVLFFVLWEGKIQSISTSELPSKVHPDFFYYYSFSLYLTNPTQIVLLIM